MTLTLYGIGKMDKTPKFDEGQSAPGWTDLPKSNHKEQEKAT